MRQKMYFLTKIIICSAIFSLSLPLFPSSPKKVKKDENLNVLLLTIDTIRADRVGYAGFDIETPNLDYLASKGAAFMDAVCQVPLTLPSHVSILTGTNPPFHKIRNNSPYYVSQDLTTLAEILKEKGWATAAFVGAFVLDSRFGLDQGFDLYDDQFETPEYLKPYEPQRLAEDVYDSSARWLNENYQKKFFIWVHYYDPHDPYTPPSPFKERYKTSPYEGEIAYTDVYVGKLVDILKNKGIFNNTLFIVIGDHGEGLWEHGEPGHGIFLYDTCLKVPLIFLCPQSIPEAKEIKEQVRTVDIFPTILDILKKDIPDFCQGKSLVPLLEGKKIKNAQESYAETYFPLISHGWSELKALRIGEWKYIQAPKPELYNLENDPDELENLFGERKKMASKLQKRLEEVEKELSSESKDPSIRELSQEEREKLMSLGYLSGVVSPSGQKFKADAKDKISTIARLAKARSLYRKKKLDEAEKIFIEIKEEEPQDPMVLHTLGMIYRKRGDWNKAIEMFKEILALNSTEVDTYNSLALCYKEKKMMKEAIEISQAALRLHPQHLKSLIFLAGAYKSLRDIKNTLFYLKKAAEVDPDDLELRLEYSQALTFSGQYSLAVQEYQELLSRWPQNPDVIGNLGRLYFYQDDFERAVEYLSKEVRIRPAVDSYFLLGASCGRLERFKEAVFYLEKYLEYEPGENKSLREKAKQAITFYKTKIK